MRRFAITTLVIGLLAAVCWAGTSSKAYVSDHSAYPFYMAQGYGVRAYRCDINVWGMTQSFVVEGDLRQAARACAILYFTAKMDDDPSVNIQTKVTTWLPEAPKR